MYIIGMWLGEKDSACCLLQDGILRSAVSESYFTKDEKKSIPVGAFLYCLEEAHIAGIDLACISLTKSNQQIGNDDVIDMIRYCFGYDGLLLFQNDRKCKIASSYYRSEMLPSENVPCDARNAIGAALIAYWKRYRNTGKIRETELLHYFFGPKKSYHSLKQMLQISDLEYDDYSQKEKDLLLNGVQLLCDGGILGYFKDRAEFCSAYGGARIVIASPLTQQVEDMMYDKTKCNRSIPIGSLVLEEENIAMTNTHGVIGHKKIINEYSNPEIYQLLRGFYQQTGCPMLLYLPYAYEQQVKVIDELEAIRYFVMSKIDALVLECFLLLRTRNSKPSISWLRIQLLNGRDSK